MYSSLRSCGNTWTSSIHWRRPQDVVKNFWSYIINQLKTHLQASGVRQLNPTILFCSYSSAKVHAVATATKAKLVRYFGERNVRFIFERKTGRMGRKRLAATKADPGRILTCQADDGNWQRNWFPLSRDVWQSAPSTFVRASITAALTPAQWTLSGRLPFIFIWLGEILLTFCPENGTRENLVQRPDSIGFILWGGWMCPDNISSELVATLCWGWQKRVKGRGGGSPKWLGFNHPVATMNINLTSSCWDILQWT